MAANNNPIMPSPAPVAADQSTQAGPVTAAPPSAGSEPTKPFPHYPHILHFASTNQYIELECPFCGANARGDSPYDFLDGLRAFVEHIRKMHGVRNFNIWSHAHKVLSGAEVAKIRAGEAQSIVKRKGFNKEIGHAEEKPSNALLEQYQSVIPSDNKYYKLACHICGATCRQDRGGSGMIWIISLASMKRHMNYFHRDLDGRTVTDRWLLDNCGTEISKEEFQQLKRDMTGGMIEKTLGAEAAKEKSDKGPKAVDGGRKRKRGPGHDQPPLHFDQAQDQARDISMLAGLPDMNAMTAFGTAASVHQQVHTGSSNVLFGQPSSASRARPHVGPGVYAPGSQRPLGLAAQMMMNANMPVAPSVDAHASGPSMLLGIPHASSDTSTPGAAIRTPIVKGPTNQAQDSPSPYAPGRLTRSHTQPAMLPPPSGPQIQPRPPVSQGPIEEVDYILDDEAPPGWRPAGAGGWRTYPDGENTVFREPYKPGDPLILPPMPKK